MSLLSEKSTNSNKAYEIYYQDLFGFVYSCEFAVDPIAESSCDVK